MINLSDRSSSVPYHNSKLDIGYSTFELPICLKIGGFHFVFLLYLFWMPPLVEKDQKDQVDEVEVITYRFEKGRAIASGIIETLPASLGLLIAIRFFEAGQLIQSLVATGGAGGLLLGPWAVSFFKEHQIPVSKAAAYLWTISAVSFLMITIFSDVWVYTIGYLVGLISATSSIPLITQMYQQNYPKTKRGTLFSKTGMIRVGTSLTFASLAGLYLNNHIERWQQIYLIVAIAFGVAAYCLYSCPSESLRGDGKRGAFRSLRTLKEDRRFFWVIVSWMLLGFGNLMLMALRVKYLSETQFGFNYSEFTVTLITAIAPAMGHLLFTYFWGVLFDRINFFVLRIFLNLLFVMAHAVFFFGDSFFAFLLGGFLLGVAFSGGSIAWSLWVTKIAKPDKVADYMSVHTFTTGARMLIAPLIAIPLVSILAVDWLVWTNILLTTLSIVILIPEVTTWKKRAEGTPMIEEMKE